MLKPGNVISRFRGKITYNARIGTRSPGLKNGVLESRNLRRRILKSQVNMLDSGNGSKWSIQ